MIRVVLPTHLRTLAQVQGEVELEVAVPVTQRSGNSRREFRECLHRETTDLAGRLPGARLPIPLAPQLALARTRHPLRVELW